MNIMNWVVSTGDQLSSKEKFPRTHNTAVALRDPNTMEENRIQFEKFVDRIIIFIFLKDFSWIFFHDN